MITRLKIRNYRLLREVTLDLHPGCLTVLIGPNSSGKSTVLETLDLLSAMASSRLEDAVYRARFGMRSIQTAGSLQPTEIEVTFASEPGLPTAADRGPVVYGVQLDERGGSLVIRDERLEVHKRGLGQAPLKVMKRRDARAELLNATTKSWDRVEVGASELLLTTIGQPAFYPTIGHVREALAATRVYPGFRSVPEWARDPRESGPSPRESTLIRSIPRIDRRGLDLVNALYTIHARSPETWEALLQHLQAEFPFVSRLFFPPDPGGGRIALGWEDRRFPGVELTAREMSEGMFAYCAILAAILAPDWPAVLAFDEPDAHVHPSAIRRLIGLLEDLTDKTSVVITTHSDRLLDYLNDPGKSIVTCDPVPDGVRLERLDQEALKRWREVYSMSDLRRQGHLDHQNQDDPLEL